MRSRIDLHVHSLHSGDTDADPEESIERAVERGLDGIAFTEHYSYGASEPVERLREKYRGVIMVLRGVEFSAAEGHCLVFGVDTDTLALKYAPVLDLVRTVNERGGVVIPSHPFRPGTSLGDLVLRIDEIPAIEGYNGNNMHAYNEKAIAAARERGLSYTGGSDAHESREVGSCFTEFDDRVTYENFIDRIREGRYRGVDVRKISRARFP
jgi:predicted metal-dependent phosphoesterase TrpH